MKKTSRNTLVLTGTAFLLALTTACSGVGESGVNDSSSTSPSVSVTPTVQNIAGTVVNGMPTKPELTVDAQGRSYAQVTVKEDDPMVAYKPEIRKAKAIELFTEEEVISAQKFASKFIFEEMSDSFLKGDKITQADKDLWWEKNKDKFDLKPVDWQQFITVKAYDPQELVVYQNPERAAKGYSLEYGADKTHVSSRHFAYEVISAKANDDGSNYISFNFNMYFDFPVMHTDGSKAHEAATLSGQLVLSQTSPDDWKISGINVKQGPVTYSK